MVAMGLAVFAGGLWNLRYAQAIYDAAREAERDSATM